MIIERKSISAISEKDLAEIYKIYNYSFPIDERRDWQDIINKDKEEYHPEAILSREGDLLGLFFHWKWADIIYIEHIAISRDFRSRGIASSLFNRLIEDNPNKKILLEIELPSISTEAKKRYDFYKKLGFEVLDDKYIQLAYSKDKKAIEMYLLSQPLIANKEETVKELYKLVYNQE